MIGNPWPLFVYFWSFPTSIQLFNKWMWKISHMLANAGIWTLDLFNMSLLPKPPEKGLRIFCKFYSIDFVHYCTVLKLVYLCFWMLLVSVKRTLYGKIVHFYRFSVCCIKQNRKKLNYISHPTFSPIRNDHQILFLDYLLTQFLCHRLLSFPLTISS